MTDQPDYEYFECPACEYSIVQKAGVFAVWCPLCASDCGHRVVMDRRACQATDKPEGLDVRPAKDRP